jgi:hypothetical protein
MEGNGDEEDRSRWTVVVPLNRETTSGDDGVEMMVWR